MGTGSIRDPIEDQPDRLLEWTGGAMRTAYPAWALVHLQTAAGFLRFSADRLTLEKLSRDLRELADQLPPDGTVVAPMSDPLDA